MSKAKELLKFYEMAITMNKEDTGLPMTIWCPADYKIQHSKPYMKVSLTDSNTFNSSDSISVSIEESPTFLRSIKGFKKGGPLSGSRYKLVSKFIKKNLKSLILHWKGELSDKGLFNSIEKI